MLMILKAIGALIVLGLALLWIFAPLLPDPDPRTTVCNTQRTLIAQAAGIERGSIRTHCREAQVRIIDPDPIRFSREYAYVVSEYETPLGRVPYTAVMNYDPPIDRMGFTCFQVRGDPDYPCDDPAVN